MKKIIYYKAILLIFLIGYLPIVKAQKKNTSTSQKETADEYLSRMKAMMDSIKQAKNEGKSNKPGNNNSPAIQSKYTNSKYSTNKIRIESAYGFLAAADKEKVKHYPPVPDAFRTNIDAQNFFNTVKNIDINADLQKSAKGTSITLTGYLISYLKAKTNAEGIINEGEKLKNQFIKNNPTTNFGTAIGKTYVSENGMVYLPLGDASFVDEVVDAKFIKGNLQFPQENCISTPNYVEGKKLEFNKGIYSLGLNGTLTIKFTNNALVDVNGPDLFVFEAGQIEPTNLEISKDGMNWIPVEKIEGGTASVDISKVAKPTDYFYYVRLTDLNTTSTIAGADIDAVAAIGAAIKLSLNAEVLFDLGKANLKPDGIVAVKNLAIQLKTMSTAQLTIDGYTDDIGTDEANIKLSLQRAQAVSTVLKEELKSNINFVYKETGKGKANPAVPNTNDENRKKNRRVEILVMPK